jgi:hypothetical protein
MRKVRSILYGAMAFFLIACNQPVKESGCKDMNVVPKIFPDYNDVTIPSNIAPLNFLIDEKGINYQAHIFSTDGKQIYIYSKNGKIEIPQGKWKKLLQSNKGSDIKIEVFVQDKAKSWSKFNPVVISVSGDEIDSHLAYRIINVGYILWKKLGLYQRDLTSFRETPIMLNRNTNGNCMNCHSFRQNSPDQMMFHMRGEFAGTVIIDNNTIKKINTKTSSTISAGAYSSWHPDGKHIAFSVDMVNQWFHGVEKRNEVYDKASDIVVYNIETNTLSTSPRVSSRNRETLPCWSPDGKYIYYCSTLPLTDSIAFEDVKYDLLRIPYDVNSNKWGRIDTVLTAQEAGGSISFPKISPDGRWLMFTRSDHGYFTIYNSTSDLCLLNLATKELTPFPYNSNEVESYHSWSQNGRWIVFSSKRIDGLCSRPFFTHVDQNGKFSKPFVMPQKDPSFYESFKNNYNVPELVNGAITVNKSQLLKVARDKSIPANFDSNMNVDGSSGATNTAEQDELH